MKPEREYRATIRINMDGIPGRLQVRLQWYINMVAFGLQASEHFESAQLVLPNARMTIRLSGDSAAWNVTEIRKAFANWVVACGLRELIEEFSGALEESRQILAVWALGSGEIRAEDWNEKIVAEAKRFHRLGLPDKLAFLQTQYQVALPPDKEKDLISLNRARNCLVHREGIISLQDLPVTKEQFDNALMDRRRRFPDEKWTNQQIIDALKDAGLQPSLEVTWPRFELFTEKDGVESIIDPRARTPVEGGSMLSLRMVKERAEFEFGSVIRLSADAVSDIGYALLNTAFALRDAVEARGRALGANFEGGADSGAG